MEDQKGLSADRILSMLAILISLTGLLVAYRAIRISEEANIIAREANQIMEQQITTNLVGNFQFWSPTIHFCLNPTTNNNDVYAVRGLHITLTNHGGLLTTLYDVRVEDSDGRTWDAYFYGDFDLQNAIELPIDIPSGASRKIYAVGMERIGRSGVGIGDPDEPKAPYGDFTLTWNLLFSNDEFQTVSQDHWGYVTGDYIKDEICPE